MTDHIRVYGISAHARHGVFDHEKRDGQTFSVDVDLETDMSRSGASDNLDHTIHYGLVAERVHKLLTEKPSQLLENLAAIIADALLTEFGPDAVTVTVHKPQAPITVPFTDVTVTVRREAEANVPEVTAFASLTPVPAVLSLGANMGDAKATLKAAISWLHDQPNILVTGVSSPYRTAPIGGPEQADYVNAVVLVHTTLSPEQLLDVAQAVEREHGRTRDVRWGPRTLDVDVIDNNHHTKATARLTLPHPRAAERAFVLVPWLEVDADARLGGRSVAHLARAVVDQDIEREDWQ